MKNKILLTISLTVFGLTSSIAQLPNYVPANGLVGWWPFDGNANDQTINANNGTISGAILTVDRFGNSNAAYSFNGVGDYIEIPSTSNYNGTELTVGFWAKGNIAPSSTGGGSGVNPGILTKLDPSGSYPPPNGFYFYEIGGLANVSFGSIGGTVTYTGTIVPFTDSLYHFLLFTYKENDTIKFYVDNELYYYSVGSNIISNNEPIRLGTSNSPFWKSFEGIIDDIAIYDRVLDSIEITSLYTGSINQQPCILGNLPISLMDSLVAWYPFCGDAHDETGNGHNGIINGATLTTDRFGNSNSAFSFNGLNDSIAVQDAPGLNIQNGESFSAALWLKSDTLNSGKYFLSKYAGVMGQGDAYAFGTQDVNNPGGPYSYFEYPGGYTETRGLTQIADTNWHHFACVFNSGSSFTVYLDGQIDTSIQTSFAGSIINTLNLSIGTGGLAQFFKGKLDDIRIYNRALDSSSIVSLYNENICFQTITVTDTLIINANLTGFNPVVYQNSIKVYPNPSNDHITIDCGSNYSTLSGYSMRIDNAIGQTVFTTPITQQSYYIDLNTWTGNGLYLIYLLNAGGQVVDVRKIVIQ